MIGFRVSASKDLSPGPNRPHPQIGQRLSSARLQDGSYQPGRAYHSTHEDRYDFAAARAAWDIERQCGMHQVKALEAIDKALFMKLRYRAAPGTARGHIRLTSSGRGCNINLLCKHFLELFIASLAYFGAAEAATSTCFASTSWSSSSRP
jgi:hypothetical protein